MPRQIFDNDEPLFDYGFIDEMAALGMGDRGYADVNPPPGSNELFEDQFERRAREIQRQPSNIQPVSVIPAKSGPWSANNQLGNELEFAPSSNNEQTILKLDEWGFPEVWSVMLGMKYSDTKWPAGALGFACTAKVNAGAGGITQEAEVDWVQGTVFSLPMNAVNVIAKYQQSNNIPTDLRLSASICKGKVAGRPPTRTFVLPVVTNPGGGGFSDPIRIPNFARSVMLVDTLNNAGGVSVYNATTHLILQRNNNVGATSCAFVNGNDLLQFGSNGYPIPDGARYFVVSVDGVQPTASPTAIFFLSL